MNLDSIIDETVGSATILKENHDAKDMAPCAGLNVQNGQVSVMSVLETPWHQLGTVIDKAANSAEALRFANLDDW